MENNSLKAIKKYNMISKCDSIVVGLSGGADSCALLFFLVSLREKYELNIIACHINHLIRGEEADRDENFSREFCKKLNVPFRLLRIDVPAIAREKKEGIEKCARDIRYDFFEKTADEFGAKIATAHTASDNAETVIFNIARGCGLKGLCGIPPVRGRIIRPLIMSTREDIEKYCAENNLEFITDSTNLEDEYNRNKIRHNVMPVLMELNSSVVNNISRMTELVRCNDDYLYSQAKSLLESAFVCKGNINMYKVKTLNNSDDTVFAKAMFILLEEFDVIPENKHISLIRKICIETGAVQIKGNIFAVSKQGLLRIIEKKEIDYTVEVPFNNNDIVINNKKITLYKYCIAEFYKAEKKSKFLFINSGDYDTIPKGAVFRYRRSGDVFCIPQRNVKKSLKKLFNELKIPAEKRNSVLILAAGSKVLWIEGIGFSGNNCISDETLNVLKLEITDF